MAYAPINKDHAIAAVAFAVTFKDPLTPEEINAVKEAHDTWRDELPAVRSPQSLSFDLRSDAPRLVASPTVAFSYLHPDGTEQWAMLVGGLTLTVTCRLYSRWDQVWGKAKSLLGRAISVVDAKRPDREVTELILEVNDSFKGPMDAKVDFVRQGSPLLSSRVYGETGLWHQHSGWFRSFGPSEQCLEQINIDAIPEGDGKLVRIVHRQLLRREGLFLSQLTPTLLETSMDHLHKANKDMLKLILADDMLDEIGLK